MMDKLENFQTTATEYLKKMLALIKTNWRVSLLLGLSLVLVTLMVAVFIPQKQRQIRVEQIASLVEKDVNGVKQVSFVEYGQLDQTIRKNDKLTVALVDINDENYPLFIKSLNNASKMAQYEGKLYFYPLIYDKKAVTETYHLTGGITLIYFENLVAQERTTLSEKKEIDLYLMDHLNSFGQAKIVKPETEEKTTESSTATSESANSEEEVIDELQGTE